jgi:hypothetical protein
MAFPDDAAQSRIPASRADWDLALLMAARAARWQVEWGASSLKILIVATVLFGPAMIGMMVGSAPTDASTSRQQPRTTASDDSGVVNDGSGLGTRAATSLIADLELAVPIEPARIPLAAALVLVIGTVFAATIGSRLMAQKDASLGDADDPGDEDFLAPVRRAMAPMVIDEPADPFVSQATRAPHSGRDRFDEAGVDQMSDAGAVPPREASALVGHASRDSPRDKPSSSPRMFTIAFLIGTVLAAAVGSRLLRRTGPRRASRDDLDGPA